MIKATLQINEVIVAIMLNYIAQLLTSYLVNHHFMAGGTMVPQTEAIPAGMQLQNLVPNTQLTTSLYISLLMCLLYWFTFRYTVFGYEVKALGNNRHAANTGGVHTVWTTVLIMQSLERWHPWQVSSRYLEPTDGLSMVFPPLELDLLVSQLHLSDRVTRLVLFSLQFCLEVSNQERCR